MFTSRRLRILALALGVAAPIAAASAQGGRVGAPPDTTSIRLTAGGYLLNYENQPLAVIINSLIEAGGLNASASNIPTKNASLKMGTPVPRDSIAPLLISFADQNGLKINGDSTGRRLMRIEGIAPQQGPTPQQLQQQQLAATQLKLYTHRLKHASAVQLAPVLQNLFTGTATTGQVAFPAGAANNFQILPGGGGGGNAAGNAAGAAAPGGRGGGGGGGNGRGGGGNAAAQLLNGILGGALGGGGGGGRAGVAGALGQLAQAQPGGVAALSASSAFIRIMAEESTNSLLVRATETDWALIQQVLEGVDLRPLQVLIEVTIAEVTRTHDLNVGVSGSATTAPKTINGTKVTGTQPSSAGDRDFILQLAGGKGTIDFNVAIAALQARGDVRISSLPVIIAENNRQASLNVGSSRPFVQVSQTVPNDPTGRVQTIQYLDVGTVLTITPTINPDGYVNLQVTQTDNSATNEVAFDAPVLSKREATTQVFVRDGQTTVLGGLAGTVKSTTKSGIPFLSQIPFLGAIFRSTKDHSETNELFLFLTPHVIDSDDDTDKLVRSIKDGSALLQTINVGPRIIPGADTLKVPPIRIRPDTTTLFRPDPIRFRPR